MVTDRRANTARGRGHSVTGRLQPEVIVQIAFEEDGPDPRRGVERLMHGRGGRLACGGDGGFDFLEADRLGQVGGEAGDLAVVDILGHAKP